MSSGRVQHCFPAKKELIEAAFERGNALSSERIAAGPRRTLDVVLTELVPHDAATRAHLRVRQSFTAALADEAIAARLRADYARLHGRLADLIRADQAAGRVPPAVDADEAAVALVALAEGLAYYVLIGAHPADYARARVLRAIADLYA